MRLAVSVVVGVVAIGALAGCGSPRASSQPAPTDLRGSVAASTTPTSSARPTTSPSPAASSGPVAAIDARLVDPIGLVVDDAGNLYVSD